MCSSLALEREDHLKTNPFLLHNLATTFIRPMLDYSEDKLHKFTNFLASVGAVYSIYKLNEDLMWKTKYRSIT
jgi:hypothetical protein